MTLVNKVDIAESLQVLKKMIDIANFTRLNGKFIICISKRIYYYRIYNQQQIVVQQDGV